MLKKYNFRNYNYKLVICSIILAVIGVLLVGSAAPDLQKKQMLGLLAGIFLMIFISLIDYNFVLNFYWIIYICNIILLLMVRLLGESAGGATRWVSIMGIRFQPSELAKLLIILFFAKFFMLYYENLNTIKMLFITVVLIIIPLILIKIQPDLSTTIVAALIFCVLIFCAGLSYKIIGGVLAVVVPAAIIFITLLLKNGKMFLSDYQYKRIMAWLNPSEYADAAYQQINSITAIGSGQLYGKGLNNNVISSVKNGNFISEAQTDFIFAVAGEELGFLGCLLIIVLLISVIILCLLTAKKAQDLAGKLICCGVAAYIGFQGFINICVATGLMPNTGLPLPFISYGLSSLFTVFMGIGFVLNVGLQPRKY